MKWFSSALGALVAAGVLILCVLLFRAPSERYTIVSARVNHTYFHTHDAQTVPIDILTSPWDAYYFMPEAIVSIEIRCNEEDTRIPFALVAVEDIDTVHFDQRDFVMRRIRLRPKITMGNHRFLITDARLRFEYIENEPLEIEIGSFGYAYYDSAHQHMFVHAIYNVHDIFADIPTSTGVILGLRNETDETISIANMYLNAFGVASDLANAIRYDGPVHAYLGIETAMDARYESIGFPAADADMIALDAGEEIFLLVPFRYRDEYQLLHRYPLMIEYVYNGVVYTLIEDDFPYIRTALFSAKGRHHVIIHPH